MSFNPPHRNPRDFVDRAHNPFTPRSLRAVRRGDAQAHPLSNGSIGALDSVCHVEHVSMKRPAHEIERMRKGLAV